MKKMILLILSKLFEPKHYLWIRYRLDKYLGWKGMDPKKILHFYWKNPAVDGGSNAPDTYLPTGKNRETSTLLVRTISEYVGKDSSILELGCNVGRNLKFLKDAGFTRLKGVEINEKAIQLLHDNFPDLAKDAAIVYSSIEDFFKGSGSGRFDLIFTSAVLEHLPNESEWVFDKMAEWAEKFILTLEIEDEKVNFHRIVGRKYRNIFESKGFQCVREEIVDKGSKHGSYTLRVFEKLRMAARLN